MQNVGEAAVVNADVLNDDNIVCECAASCSIRSCPMTIYLVAIEDWADGVKAFVASGRLDGHKLVAVGHSSGTCLT